MHKNTSFVKMKLINACSRTGVGNLFTITGHINYILPLASRNINSYPKILPLSNYKEELEAPAYHGTSFCVLTRCCILTRVTKILMRAKSNVHA